MNNSRYRMMGIDSVDRNFENPDLLHPKVREFLVSWPTLIDGPYEDADREPGKIYPSPQGWEDLSDWLLEYEPTNGELPEFEWKLTQVTKELLGIHVSIMFPKFYVCG